MSLGRTPGRTDLAGGEEGRWPGCGNFSPGARSTGWFGRPGQPRLLQAGSHARTHTHPHPTPASARAHPHSPTLVQPQSPSGAGQCDPNAPLSYGGHSAVTGSAPRGRRHPTPPARPPLYLRRPQPPGAQLPPPRGWPPARRSVPRGLRPAVSRPRLFALPSAGARSGAAPCAHPARIPRTAGRPGRAPRRRGPGRPRSRQRSAGRQRDTALRASTAARPQMLQLWRAGRGVRTGGAEGGPK